MQCRNDGEELTPSATEGSLLEVVGIRRVREKDIDVRTSLGECKCLDVVSQFFVCSPGPFVQVL